MKSEPLNWPDLVRSLALLVGVVAVSIALFYRRETVRAWLKKHIPFVNSLKVGGLEFKFEQAFSGSTATPGLPFVQGEIDVAFIALWADRQLRKREISPKDVDALSPLLTDMEKALLIAPISNGAIAASFQFHGLNPAKAVYNVALHVDLLEGIQTTPNANFQAALQTPKRTYVVQLYGMIGNATPDAILLTWTLAAQMGLLKLLSKGGEQRATLMFTIIQDSATLPQASELASFLRNWFEPAIESGELIITLVPMDDNAQLSNALGAGIEILMDRRRQRSDSTLDTALATHREPVLPHTEPPVT